MLLQTRVHISPLRALQALLCTRNLTRWAAPAMLKSSVWRARNETTWGPPYPVIQLMGVSYLKTGRTCWCWKWLEKCPLLQQTWTSSVVCLMQRHTSLNSSQTMCSCTVYALQNREIHTESCDESPGCSLSQNMSTTCPGIPRTALCAMFPCEGNAAAPPASGSECVPGLLGTRSGMSRSSKGTLKSDKIIFTTL